jgi:hypothetical protein
MGDRACFMVRSFLGRTGGVLRFLIPVLATKLAAALTSEVGEAGLFAHRTGLRDDGRPGDFHPAGRGCSPSRCPLLDSASLPRDIEQAVHEHVSA